MKRVFILLLTFIIISSSMSHFFVRAENSSDVLNLEAPSVVLMEPYSGKVIYEKNSHEKLRPASITKIMTLILIFDALEAGKIKLEDIVTVSEHATSMGGSQVFLEVNETQTVDTMIKCIAVASANDASVAMAEHISGSEEAFVQAMNERAKQLGMTNTNFENASGLDRDNHLTTAYDIALMSKELLTKYPQIKDYSMIWMDTIIHKTKRGESEFGLANTNKLLKWYNDTTGLKTGSTGLAKYCISASAKRNDMELIAVIMAHPDYKGRFQEAMKLLDYGFANMSIYKDMVKDEMISNMPIRRGVNSHTNVMIKDNFHFVCSKDENIADITKETILPEYLTAPIKAGSKVGEVVYKLNGEVIGKTDIITLEDVKEARFLHYWTKIFKEFIK